MIFGFTFFLAKILYLMACFDLKFQNNRTHIGLTTVLYASISKESEISSKFVDFAKIFARVCTRPIMVIWSIMLIYGRF